MKKRWNRGMRCGAFRERVVAALGFVTAAVTCLAPLDAGDSGPDMVKLGQAYHDDVQPLLERYCYRCHADDRTEADIDLSAFATIGDVRKDPRIWQKVREMLDSGQMPPKKGKEADRRRANATPEVGA